MAVSAFPSVEDSPDLTLLNVARLFTRLEYNLLSPGAELRTIRNSELQRIRVTKVSIYAGVQLYPYHFFKNRRDVYLAGVTEWHHTENSPGRMWNMRGPSSPNLSAPSHN